MSGKRRGRPPLDDDDPSVKVEVSMPSKQFDAYCKRALREDVSVPAIIRQELNGKPGGAASTKRDEVNYRTDVTLPWPRSFVRVLHHDLDDALAGHDLTPALCEGCLDDLHTFVFAPWTQYLEAVQHFSATAHRRVEVDDRVLGLAIQLRDALLGHDTFIGEGLQSQSARGGQRQRSSSGPSGTSSRRPFGNIPRRNSNIAAMDPSPGVAVIQGQVEALTDLRRSVLISPMNSPELTGALNTLIAWAQPTFEASVRWQPQRRRGRVADHRLEWLVHQTMRRLEAIGVPLLCGRRGVLASVLRVLLRAADRLEQRAPAPRTNMWKDLQRWLATYRRESNSPASR